LPRKKLSSKRRLYRDPKYNDPLVTKLINYIMKRGKKSVAEGVVYGAFDILQEKTNQDPLQVFKKALENVKPVVEVRSRRVGGATYQVPQEVRSDRRVALGLRWVITNARRHREHTMAERLAAELLLAFKGEGASIKKREDTHRMAEANKAFAHFRL
jgi:small subunit ribosomal protein S7